MIPVRQSTAFETKIGPILDADGVAVTGGVVGDFKIKKTTGDSAALNGSATLTHTSAGFYDLVLTTSDTDTVGVCVVHIDDGVNACASLYLQVIEEAIYDAMYAASANAWSGAAGSTTLTALATGSITAAVIATGAIDADAIADNAIDAGAIASDAITAAKIASDAITAAKIATGAITSAKFAAGAIDAAAIATGAIDADALAADAGTEIGAAVLAALGTGTWATAIPWNAAWDAEVQSEVDDALVAQRLDELLNADSDIDGAAPPTVGSVFHELMTKTAGSFTYDQTTDSLEAVRDRGDAAWITATGFSTHSAADVWAVATRVLTAGTNIQLPSNGLANVTAWTVDVTGNITGNLSGSVGSVTGAVGSVTGNVGGNVTGTIGGFTVAAKAEIEQEALDALQQTVPDTVPADGSRPNMQQAAYMSLQTLIECAISGTTMTVYKPDGSTALFTVTLNSAVTPTAKTRAT